MILIMGVVFRGEEMVSLMCRDRISYDQIETN